MTPSSSRTACRLSANHRCSTSSTTTSPSPDHHHQHQKARTRNMKLGLQEHVDVASGVQDEVAISFEANAVAFYAQISGLAKDKIGYPIRELSTNAWDASRGRFEVHLPTPLNPVFRVRDFGPGMSAD